jgi:hypothetical protein
MWRIKVPSLAKMACSTEHANNPKNRSFIHRLHRYFNQWGFICVNLRHLHIA